jgi:hypothetical protein
MRRIGFAVILSLSLTLAPLGAEAQPAGKVYRIGVLANAPPTTPEVSRNWEAFWQGLRERGWVEGQNIVIESRYAEGRLDRFSFLAAELVSCPSPKPHPTRLTTADTLATGQGTFRRL